MSDQMRANIEAAVWLQGLARAIKATPTSNLTVEGQEDRQRAIAEIEQAAEAVWPNNAGQDFASAVAYSANESRNNILWSIFSVDEVAHMLDKNQ